jgi:uncharacterized protein
MPDYFSPGVYVEDVPPAAHPIAGASTSTAAFIGVVPDTVTMPPKPGPTAPDYQLAAAGTPVLLTNWPSFATRFGQFSSQNATLAHAVFGFFANGGGRCYVIRAAAQDALANPGDLLGALEAFDDVSIVAVPGATDATSHQALVEHCNKLEDRVAILDGASPDALDLTALADIRPFGPSKEAAFAALYWPWILTAGPGTTITQVAPSGHVAGVYARTDATRGVFKAPANEGVLGAVDLTYRVSRGEQDVLNPAGINAIRAFNGAIKVWGARTLADSTAAEFTYVSTRRYLCFLRDSIIAGTDWVVFEPNSPSLWQKIVRNVGDFLLGQWRDGALFGQTAAQAFYVRCDETTNPPEVRDLGRLVTEIGVAVVKPAEFVVFRIQQTTGQ